MKTVDIKMDGTEYAVAVTGVSPRYGPFLGDEDSVVRVTVIEVKVERRVPKIGYRNNTVKDGIRVAVAGSGKEYVLRPAQVLGAWADHLVAGGKRVESEKALTQRREKIKREREKAREVIQSLLPAEVYTKTFPYVLRDVVRLDVRELAELLIAARDGGQATVVLEVPD